MAGSIECRGCGLCCMHMRTPPFLGPDDPRFIKLPQELKVDWFNSPRYKLMLTNDGAINPCLWLDMETGDCKHYKYRPDVCRDYRKGNKSCRELVQVNVVKHDPFKDIRERIKEYD